MEDFKKELAELLRKHSMAIIATGDNGSGGEVGYMRGLECQEWTGRCHVTAYDIDGKQSSAKGAGNER